MKLSRQRYACGDLLRIEGRRHSAEVVYVEPGSPDITVQDVFTDEIYDADDGTAELIEPAPREEG